MKAQYWTQDSVEQMSVPGYWDNLRRRDGRPESPEKIEAVKTAEVERVETRFE